MTTHAFPRLTMDVRFPVLLLEHLRADTNIVWFVFYIFFSFKDDTVGLYTLSWWGRLLCPPQGTYVQSKSRPCVSKTVIDRGGFAYFCSREAKVVPGRGARRKEKSIWQKSVCEARRRHRYRKGKIISNLNLYLLGNDQNLR